LLFAEIVERVLEPVAHLIAHNPTDAYPARLSKRLQTRRDVDPIAEDVLAFDNHIAKVDTDAELDPFGGRGSLIALGHPTLDLHGAPHRVHHAGKLRQETVARVLDDPATVLGDFGFDQFAQVRPQSLVRALLICPHQARIAGHVGG